MTLNLIKNIIISYVRELRNIDATNADDYKGDEHNIKKRLLECINLLRGSYPELFQMNMPGIIGEDDAEEFKKQLGTNASHRYSVDILPTGNCLHDKVNDEDIYTPEYVKWQDENNALQNIVINYRDESQEKAIFILNNILMNIMLALPRDMVHLNILDINFKGMAGLFTNNLDPKLYHDEIIDNLDKFRTRIKWLTEQMSTAMKNYGDVVAYNNRQKTIAMPYEIVVLNCYPRNYDPYIEELLPLFENGPKYGVYFVVMNNLDYSLRKEDTHHLFDIRNYQIIQIPKILSQSKGLVSHTPICKNKQLLDMCWNYLNEEGTHSTVSRIIPQRTIIKQKSSDNGIEIAVGNKIKGNMFFKLGQTDHIHSFIIGKTGSGKSVFIHDILSEAIQNYSPQELQLYIIDCKKGVELGRYNGLNHIRALVISQEDYAMILEVLIDIEAQCNDRAEMMNKEGFQNINEYNNAHPESKMQRIWILIDECQVIFTSGDRNRTGRLIIEKLINIARQGRSFGIHLIMSTQTLSGANIPTEILNSITDRYILKCPENDARIMCDYCYGQVNQFKNAGDAFYYNDSNKTSGTFHANYLSKEQLDEIIDHVKKETTSYDSNGGFYIDGSINYSFNQDIIKVVCNNKNDNLIGCPGKTVSLKQKTVTFSLGQQPSENMLLVGIDSEGQTTRTTIDVLFSLIVSNIQSNLNYKFYVIDCWKNDDAKHKRLLSNLSSIHNISIVDNDERGSVLMRLAKSLKEGNSEPFVLVIIGQQWFRELRDNKEIVNTSQRGLFGTGKNGFSGFRGHRLENPNQESWTYLSALSYILKNGPESQGHTILQVDNIPHLLFENRFIQKRELDDLFYHQIILRSDESSTRSLELPTEIKPEIFSSDSQKLRALYLAGGGIDEMTIFSPFILPDDSTIQLLT